MSVTHIESIRNAMADAVCDTIDAGSSAGRIAFLSAAGSEIVALTASDPAFGSASGGVKTAGAFSPGTAAQSGTVTSFTFYDSDSNEAGFRGTITAQGASPEGDIKIRLDAIEAGDTITITSLTYTAAD